MQRLPKQDERIRLPACNGFDRLLLHEFQLLGNSVGGLLWTLYFNGRAEKYSIGVCRHAGHSMQIRFTRAVALVIVNPNVCFCRDGASDGAEAKLVQDLLRDRRVIALSCHTRSQTRSPRVVTAA